MCTASVCACVCTAGGCTQGQRPWERPVQARSRRARLPPRQLERISAGGKSRTRPPNCIFFSFWLLCLVSCRSSSAPSSPHGLVTVVSNKPPPTPSSSRLSNFTPSSLRPPRLLSLISGRIYFLPPPPQALSNLRLLGDDESRRLVARRAHRGADTPGLEPPRTSPAPQAREQCDKLPPLPAPPPACTATRTEHFERGDGLSQLAAAGRCFVCGRRRPFFFLFSFPFKSLFSSLTPVKQRAVIIGIHVCFFFPRSARDVQKTNRGDFSVPCVTSQSDFSRVG